MDTKNCSCKFENLLIDFNLCIEEIISRGSLCIYVLCLTVGKGYPLQVLLDGW